MPTHLRARHNRRRLIPVLFVLLTFSQPLHAKGIYDRVFTLRGAERSATLEPIFVGFAAADSSLALLRQIILKEGSASDKLQLHYHEEKLKLQQSRSDRFTKFRSLLEQCLAQAKALDNHYLQALFYFYLSEVARDEGQHNRSFENKLYALDELAKDESGKFFEQSWMLYEIAREYYWFKDYKAAAWLARTAFGFGGKFQPGGTTWFLLLSSNLTGAAYLKAGQLDSARVWLSKTYELAKASDHQEWLGISVGNLGDLHYAQQQYKKAIPFYLEAIPRCTANGLWDNVAPFCTALANCYLQSGNLAPVKDLLQKASFAMGQLASVNRNYVHYYAYHIQYYRTLIDYLKRTKPEPGLARYADSLARYTAKEEETFSRDKKTLAEVQLAYRNKTLENEVTSRRLQHTQWTLYFLTATLLALAAIVVLLIKRRNLKQQLRQELLVHQRMMAEEELHLALTEIKDFTLLVQQKNQLIEQFSEQIELLKAQSISIPDERLQRIEEIRQSVILTEDDWNRFKQSFERVHPGYLARLKEKFPDFTQAEIRYCLLTKLDLSTKEMTAMLGVTPEALRHIRFRLRRKLQEFGVDVHTLILGV